MVVYLNVKQLFWVDFVSSVVGMGEVFCNSSD
jgi:hypothetical protein